MSNNESLFSNTLLKEPRVDNDNIEFRSLEITDYEKGFSEVLQQLTEAKFEKSKFIERYLQMKQYNDTYFVIVAEDKSSGKIVAAGSLIVEKKFIRGVTSCGHIEDIVVDKTYRGKNLGLKIIQQLKHLGKIMGCYKLILDCDEKNEKFYAKNGFERKAIMMAVYLPTPKL
ncbi:glucosamine 6-phosphate N-acetyltransferase [Tieghemostelium lacteum]|uniref:Glucosamine 6-phosphate N-acetyltransferase n=1 Tax=Tieghemostelium lacteum TaxID=361077 RepID=A0A151ZBM7_TIELA|nr:glucosamine 6-phosphate N-acetyltransferase [Tieghemostelium lacteum]|eukprot:KYQ91353.1 glucosamine 6-phosphate N-acetyltransferase [Tieghemostelium lacteum]